MQSHHRPRDGPFELNDVFAIINAVPAVALMSYGFFNPGIFPGLCFGAVSIKFRLLCLIINVDFYLITYLLNRIILGDNFFTCQKCVIFGTISHMFSSLINLEWFLYAGTRNNNVWNGLYVCPWRSRPPSFPGWPYCKCSLFKKSCCCPPSKFLLLFLFLFFSFLAIWDLELLFFQENHKHY